VPKVYESDQALHHKILEGVNILTDNVASTLGPKGRNVILHQKDRNPIITKDGVTVANFVDFDDPVKNLGAQIIKQASQETNNVAGDGTTTATVLTRGILCAAQKFISSGVPPNEIKKGIEQAVKLICEKLGDMSSPISTEEDIQHVASISANGDKTIGKMIATAVDAIGKDGTITVEEGRSIDTTLDVIEGFRFDSGYAAQAFVTDERKNLVKHNNVLILVTDNALESVEQMLPTLEIAARAGQPLIVVADTIEGQALAALIMNSVRGTMKVVGVKAPRYGEERRNILSDLAVATGATFITREADVSLEDVRLEHLGKAASVEVLKNFTTIVGGTPDLDALDLRIENLKETIKQTDDLYECEKLQERIVRLSSGVAVIRVGAHTEVEMIEKKHRIEDALEAVRSAQLEGIVPGGGVALVRCAQKLKKVKTENNMQSIGVEIVRDAVREPLRQMAINAGESPDVILASVEKQKGNKGYDFATGKIVDLVEAGILDPVKVTKTALQNAASVAGTLLTTNHAIVQVD